MCYALPQMIKMTDIKIPKKVILHGEDGYKSFTIRVTDQLESQLSNIAYQTYRSRNEIVNMLLEEAIKHVKYEK